MVIVLGSFWGRNIVGHWRRVRDSVARELLMRMDKQSFSADLATNAVVVDTAERDQERERLIAVNERHDALDFGSSAKINIREMSMYRRSLRLARSQKMFPRLLQESKQGDWFHTSSLWSKFVRSVLATFQLLTY